MKRFISAGVAACALAIAGCMPIALPTLDAREDSAVFVAAVRSVRDSLGPYVQFSPEPLGEPATDWLYARARARLARSREAWLWSAGFVPVFAEYEPCSGIFVLNGHGKQGCPQTSITIAKVSTVEHRGRLRAVEVSARSLSSIGSSEAWSYYVFAARGRGWTLVAREWEMIVE